MLSFLAEEEKHAVTCTSLWLWQSCQWGAGTWSCLICRTLARFSFWELPATEAPRFAGWWPFALLQTINSQVFCRLYTRTCRTLRIKIIWLLKLLVIHLCLPKLALLSLTFHQRRWFCAALSSSVRSTSCVPWQVFPLVWCSLWLFDNLRMETVVKCGRLQFRFSRSQICFLVHHPSYSLGLFTIILKCLSSST